MSGGSSSKKKGYGKIKATPTLIYHHLQCKRVCFIAPIIVSETVLPLAHSLLLSFHVPCRLTRFFPVFWIHGMSRIRYTFPYNSLQINAFRIVCTAFDCVVGLYSTRLIKTGLPI